MFGLFRRKPKYTGEQVLSQLGEFSSGIVSAAAEADELMVALKGAAVVAVIIRESNRCYGLNVKPDTIFFRFAIAIEEEDLETMAAMTREMADALGQVDGPTLRGGLVHFWLNGYH